MKTSETSHGFRPFENLKAMLDNCHSKILVHEIELKSARKKKLPAGSNSNTEQTVSTPEYETELFLKAMNDVTPISKGNYPENRIKPRKPRLSRNNPDAEIKKRLKRLVSCGEGFVVANTSEYMEGTGYHVNPEILKSLHKGIFSIQDHIDLHGLSAAKAENHFNAFLKESIRTGKRGVLIVHGRGLSSPEKPVLKQKVYEWLTGRPWRKWIVAFTSARAVDGGAGATYVLLRRYPATKRLIKKK